MKKIREIKLERHDDPRRKALIVHHGAHLGLIKINRFLFCLVLLLLTIIFLFSFSLIPPNQSINNFINGKILTAKGPVVMNPVISEEIDGLKNQMVGLISGSIDSKLRVLELSIQSGSTTKLDLGLINDLREDILVLRGFSDLQQAKLFAPKSETAAEIRAAGKLMHELTQLKMLIYITLTSCGLMFAAMAGAWLQRRYLLSYERKLLKTNRFIDHE